MPGLFTGGLNVSGGGGVPSSTVGPMDLYVSGINGSDANNGLTPATALATLTAAVDLVPDVIDDPAHRVIVHIGRHGGTGYVPPFIGNRLVRSRLWLLGDGAGQAGEDGFAVVAGVGGTGTGDGTSTDERLVFIAGGMTVDAFMGKTIEITSGAAIGDRRLVVSNDATTFVPSHQFTASVAGSTYRIVEPDVVLNITRLDAAQIERSFCQGIGLDGVSFPHPNVSALVLAQLRLANTGVICFPGFARSRVACYGVEVADADIFPNFNGSHVNLGCTGDQFGAYEPLDDLAVPSRTSWLGWGITKPTTTAFAQLFALPDFTTCKGYFVGNRVFLQADTTLTVFGGRLYGEPASTFSTMDINDTCIVRMRGQRSTLPFIIEATGGRTALSAEEGADVRVTGNTDIDSDAGPAVRCDGMAHILFTTAGGVAVDSVSGFGVDASGGGSVLFQDHGPAVNGGAGDLSVDGVSAAATAVLAANGDAIVNPDSSVIARVDG